MMTEVTRAEARYLRALRRLGGLERFVGSSEVARELGVSKPTSVIMLKRLEAKGLVCYEKRRGARITEDGEACLRELDWRHVVIESLLTSVGIPEEEACMAAREMELCVPLSTLVIACRVLGHPSESPCGLKAEHPEVVT